MSIPSRHNFQKAFTFIEIIIVVAIISAIATLLVVAVQAIRISGRDIKRVNDINEIRNALNLYYSKYSQYPTLITPGQTFSVGSIKYLEKVPTNPTPHTDKGCPDKDYDYAQTNGGISYTLSFCLGYKQDAIPAGSNKAIPEGIVPGP
jgi:prepilin-type N-terminal cleavage/methylation domain-containing protein